MAWIQFILNQLVCHLFKYDFELLEVVYVMKYLSWEIAYHKGERTMTSLPSVTAISWIDFWKSHFSDLLYWKYYLNAALFWVQIDDNCVLSFITSTIAS